MASSCLLTNVNLTGCPMAKYKFTFWLEKPLEPQEVNDLEQALWVQLEDWGCKLCQLVEVESKSEVKTTEND